MNSTNFSSSKIRNFLCSFATFFGLGHLSKAPGTIGTLAAAPLVFALSQLGSYFYLIFVILLLPFSILVCELYEQNHPDRGDPQEVIFDEIIGFFITMTWLPLTWQAFALGFLLFRFFDILKPFPINILDKKIKGGLGIVIDDVAAGLISNLILQFIYMKTTWLGIQLIL